MYGHHDCRTKNGDSLVVGRTRTTDPARCTDTRIGEPETARLKLREQELLLREQCCLEIQHRRNWCFRGWTACHRGRFFRKTDLSIERLGATPDRSGEKKYQDAHNDQ